MCHTTSYSCNLAFTPEIESIHARGAQCYDVTSPHMIDWRAHVQAMQRLREATELLGEREERVAELAADVADLRQMYREQVEVFVEQMAQASQHSTPQPSPRPSVSSQPAET